MSRRSSIEPGGSNRIDAVTGPVLILCAWIAGALLLSLGAHLARHAAPHPPVIGKAPDLPAA